MTDIRDLRSDTVVEKLDYENKVAVISQEGSGVAYKIPFAGLTPGARSAFSMYMPADLNMFGGTVTARSTASLFDRGGELTPATGQWTASEAGIYLITFRYNFSHSSAVDLFYLRATMIMVGASQPTIKVETYNSHTVGALDYKTSNLVAAQIVSFSAGGYIAGGVELEGFVDKALGGADQNSITGIRLA